MRTPARFPLALTAAALAAAAPLAAASATPVPQGPVVVAAAVASPTPDSAEGEAYAATILGRVNELRAGMGRAPLVRYVQLDAAAQAQSEQMAADGAVSHRPNFANSYPAGSSSSAEIVAVQAKADGADVAGQIVDQWMASEEDRAKMTAADANAVGIGIAYSPSTDSWYVTQSLAAYPDAAASGLTRTDGAPTAPQEPSASASPDPTTPAAPDPSTPAVGRPAADGAGDPPGRRGDHRRGDLGSGGAARRQRAGGRLRLGGVEPGPRGGGPAPRRLQADLVLRVGSPSGHGRDPDRSGARRRAARRRLHPARVPAAPRPGDLRPPPAPMRPGSRSPAPAHRTGVLSQPAASRIASKRGAGRMRTRGSS